MKAEDLFPKIGGTLGSIVAEEVAKQREQGIEKIFDLHTRALACHCECLGMNAENSLAVCQNRQVPYSNAVYFDVMKKWKLINGEGEPTI